MSSVERVIRVIFVLFMAAILGAVIYGHGGQSSEVSNWVIAGANIVMAFAAVMALKTAKRYLNEFFAKEGYRHAIEMINENIIHLGIDNRLTIICQEVVLSYEKLMDGAYSRENIDKIIKSSLTFQEAVELHKSYLKNIRELSFKIETYGIYVSKEKKNSWTDMVLCLDGLIRKSEFILSHIYSEAPDFKSILDSLRHPNDLSKEKEVNIIKENIKDHLKEINNEWNGMVSNRHDFLSGDKHVRSLFVVQAL